MKDTRDILTRQRSLDRIARVSRLMDTRYALPGGARFGWDAILGLIPVVGDTLSLAVSVWMLAEARSLGVRKRVMAKMIGNVALDWAGGLIPIVGDIWDIHFKAHRRNLKLLEREIFYR